MFSGIMKEKDALVEMFEQFKTKLMAEFKETQSLQIALKEEQDRADERTKQVSGDLQSLQRAFLGTTKKLARDVITSSEDIQTVTNIIRQLIDHSQCLIASVIELKPVAESSSKDALKNPEASASSTKLNSARFMVSANQTLQQFHQQA